MLPKETLELMLQTVRKAAKPELVPVPGVDDRIWIATAGELTEVPLPPARRDHEVEQVGDLVELAKIAAASGPEIVPTIWHTQEQVVLIWNDGERRDRVTLPLPFTKAFQTIVMLHTEKPWMTQQQLIRLLRVDLAGGVNPEVLRTVRTINFRSGEQLDSDLQVGNQRMGRAVEAKVTGAGELPEDVTCTTPVYRDRDIVSAAIRLAVDVDFQSHKFQLTPVGDQVEDAINAAQDDIRGDLNRLLGEGSPVAVYQGTP